MSGPDGIIWKMTFNDIDKANARIKLLEQELEKEEKDRIILPNHSIGKSLLFHYTEVGIIMIDDNDDTCFEYPFKTTQNKLRKLIEQIKYIEEKLI